MHKMVSVKIGSGRPFMPSKMVWQTIIAWQNSHPRTIFVNGLHCPIWSA